MHLIIAAHLSEESDLRPKEILGAFQAEGTHGQIGSWDLDKDNNAQIFAELLEALSFTDPTDDIKRLYNVRDPE